MKTFSRKLTRFGLVIAIGAIGAVLVYAEEKPLAKNVVITKNSIIIPGTEMSKADGQAMNKILKQFDKSLYKVETYENGQLKKTRGTLTDVVTDKELASEIAANVKKKGFTQYAVQVAGSNESEPGATPGGGISANTTNQPTLPPPPPPPPRGKIEPGATPTGGNPTNQPNPPPPPPRPMAAASPTGGHPTQTPPPPPPTVGALAQKRSEELVRQLKPVLEKYSKK